MSHMTKDTYATEIIQSLRDHCLATDDELSQIHAYLIA